MSHIPSSGRRPRSGSTGFPRRWRNASSTACSAALLLAAGCGGDGAEREPAPALPSKLGAALATRADRVAAELRAGDREGARAEARALTAAVVTAIRAGRVPRELREHLLGAADALAQAIPPPSPPPAVDEKAAKGEGKGKAKGKEENGDD